MSESLPSPSPPSQRSGGAKCQETATATATESSSIFFFCITAAAISVLLSGFSLSAVLGYQRSWGPTIRKREPTSQPSHPTSPPYSPSTSSPLSPSSHPASRCFSRKSWSERNVLSIGSFLSQKNSSSPLQWPPRPRRSATVAPPMVSSLVTLPSGVLSTILENLACEDWGLRLGCKLLVWDILRHAPSPTSLAQLPKSFLYKLFSNLSLVDLKNLRMAFALQKFNLNVAVKMFLYVFEGSTQETWGR